MFNFKRLGILAFILGLATLGVYAAPNSNFTWTEPTNYEDGTVIDPAADTLTYNLYCGTTAGGPYSFVADMGTGTSATVDVGSCVNGTPGTYYFAATSVSSLYGTESALSNEISRTYTASELGKVPNAPVLLTVD